MISAKYGFKYHYDDWKPQQKLLYKSNARYTVIDGGIGTFKTAACLFKIFDYCYTYPNSIVFIFANTYSQLSIVIFEQWKRIFNPDSYRYNKNDNIITLDNGSSIWLKYSENLNSGKRIKGGNISGYYVTQAETLSRRELWDELEQRTRLHEKTSQPHIRILDANPGAPSHFIYRQLIDTTSDDFIGKHPKTVSNSEGTITVTKSDLIDHIHIITTHQTSTYNQETLDIMKRAMSPIIYQRDILGKWVKSDGLIYQQFNRAIHVKNFEINTNWKFAFTCDFGYENPFAGLLIGIDNDDHVYVCDEVYIIRKTINEYIGEWVKTNWLDRYKFTEWTCDNQPADRQDLSNALGIRPRFRRHHKNVREGIKQVRRHLVRKNGKSGLTIHSKCVTLIREIESYENAKDRFGNYIDDTPIKTDDHGLDALRYYLYTVYKGIEI